MVLPCIILLSTLIQFWKTKCLTCLKKRWPIHIQYIVQGRCGEREKKSVSDIMALTHQGETVGTLSTTNDIFPALSLVVESRADKAVEALLRDIGCY